MPKHASHFGVGLTKCWYCLKDSDIVIDKRTFHGHGKSPAESAHGKVIDMRPCSECEKLMQRGIICISVPDSEEAPAEGKMPNPNRTGGWSVLTAEGFSERFKMAMNKESEPMLLQCLRRRMAILTDTAWMAMGLPRFSAGHSANLLREVPLYSVPSGIEKKFGQKMSVIVVSESEHVSPVTDIVCTEVNGISYVGEVLQRDLGHTGTDKQMREDYFHKMLAAHNKRVGKQDSNGPSATT